jgi:hypothetical protein
MKKKMISTLLWSVIIIAGISCNKNSSFLTGKAIESRLAGSWRLQPLLVSDTDENWEFSGGKLTRKEPSGVVIDEGSYSGKAMPLNSKLEISGMSNDIYNGKWTIVNLSKTTLQMTIPFKCEGGQKKCGTFMRELYR